MESCVCSPPGFKTYVFESGVLSKHGKYRGKLVSFSEIHE